MKYACTYCKQKIPNKDAYKTLYVIKRGDLEGNMLEDFALVVCRTCRYDHETEGSELRKRIFNHIVEGEDDEDTCCDDCS